jgi:hypothetical protein
MTTLSLTDLVTTDGPTPTSPLRHFLRDDDLSPAELATVLDLADRFKADRSGFRIAAEDELLALHEGNFVRYGLRPAEFNSWRAAWAPDRNGSAD